jgi:mannose-6-phosphate isomerase-like protein (cupin superfamily)
LVWFARQTLYKFSDASAEADIEKALREALANAIIHGNQQDPQRREILKEDDERCITYAKRTSLCRYFASACRAERGETSVSVFLFHGEPGSGPEPHRHPYDEIQFIREGRGVWTVNGKTLKAALEISLSSRPARSTASRRSVIRRSYNSMFTLVRDSSKGTYKVGSQVDAGNNRSL